MCFLPSLIDLCRIALEKNQNGTPHCLQTFVLVAPPLLDVVAVGLRERTRFQENDISQLVVLAKSRESREAAAPKENAEIAPAALELNDDTLLEKIKFNDVQDVSSNGEKPGVPAELQDLTPENQPKLLPEDQIILLAEATLRDSFSPADSLTSEPLRTTCYLQRSNFDDRQEPTKRQRLTPPTDLPFAASAVSHTPYPSFHPNDNTDMQLD